MEGSNGSDAAANANPQAAVDQTLTLLKTKDDTSRFVGLSLLRSLLDSNEQLRTNDKNLLQCWNAISNKFLIRLLKTQETKSKSKDEARNMVDLAVAVIHIFANLLPSQEVAEQKMIELCGPLLDAIPRLNSDPQKNAFQALQCITSTSSGANAVANFKNWKPIIDTASSNEDVLIELFRLQRAAEKSDSMSLHQISTLTSVIDTTILSIKDGGKLDSIKLLEALGELTSEKSYPQPPKWISYAIDLVRTTIRKQPTSRGRDACIKLVGNLIQGLPPTNRFSYELFNESASQNNDSNPFSYIFINLVLIEIRSTIPSLLESLASASYTSTALRLASCYDIMSAFILYLLQYLDQDANITKSPAPSSTLSPEQFLRIRKDFAETLSMTLEFFRDRWDATVSGAGGLDPGARNDPNTPLALTWDNPSVSPAGDPIILAGLRALSLWLREDENVELAQEAASLMDMYMALYSSSMSTDAKVDFRHAILTCLTGLLVESDDVVQQFLDQKGWSLLQEDLLQNITSLSIGATQSPAAHTQDIIRVLISVVESETVPQTRLPWMTIVKQLAEIRPPSLRDEEKLETLVGGWQLAVALIVKAPHNVKRAHAENIKSVQLKAKAILREVKNSLNVDLVESLGEVIEALEDIV
ncbi:hypothetical protein BLS_004683 [Venturia inaequalis]|uniref:DUF1941-domain-containing protein n=1 Tax=Venturia inaequalis TaxID=5025 RepID=A0A8H3VEB3_VENIN|nr:hypothetical protein BLS_004683 [Venturia inaequalis]KAE9971006.1 hypothetical protein EG328_005933 [Venturia inaequalis]KAE9987479.1 hypothetical protein EG327_003802 [Venturia inaequalis]